MPEWKKVESPRNTTCLFLMKGSDARPGPAPQPHPRIVLHQSDVGLKLKHGMAPGFAVENHVHGLAVMMGFI
jgi:hypothetical protein